MSLPSSSRIVLANLSGTVLDVVMRARMPEGTVRARVAELRRAGLLRVVGFRPAHHGAWRVYEPV